LIQTHSKQVAESFTNWFFCNSSHLKSQSQLVNIPQNVGPQQNELKNTTSWGFFFLGCMLQFLIGWAEFSGYSPTVFITCSGPMLMAGGYDMNCGGERERDIVL
jgi:hypothetical protein